MLQIAVAAACLVPISAGAMGVIEGPAWLRDVSVPVPPDLDSHFRYLSGVFLGLGIGFASSVSEIEAKRTRFRLLGMMVILGGLARLFSLIQVGSPSSGHLYGLLMELGVMPLLLLWQGDLARRHARASSLTTLS